MPQFFDGDRRPRLTVTAAFGGSLDPGATYLHLNVGPGLGTGQLGGAGAGAETDITGDVRSVSISPRGRASDIDSAAPVTCTVVLGNQRGDYDPANPLGPYWGANALTANQNSLEAGTTAGWEVGGNCTLATTSSQAQTGTRSLQLTAGGSGNMWANTTTGTGGVPVAAGDAVKATGWLRSATRSVTGTICVMFWDAAGNYLGQTDSAGTATSTSAWTQVQVATAAPDDAVTANVQVLYVAPIAGGEVHYADNVSLQGTGVTDGLPVRVRWSWDGVSYDRFYGELADIQVDLDITPDAVATFTCADGLEKLGRAYLPQVSNPVGEGHTSGTRIAYLADQAVWPSTLRALDTGYTSVQPTVLGAAAADLMHEVETTEFGMLFVDGTGHLVFYDRHRGATATRSTVNQATFGDPVGAIGIQTLGLGRSRERTFNRVAITRQPPPAGVAAEGEDTSSEADPAEQVADDPTTQTAKGILAFPADAGQLLRSDEEALAMAQYLVARFKTIQNRIREISVNALRGGWDDLLPLGPLDLVTVTRDYGPNTISMNLHVQGVAEEIAISPPTWNLTLSTSNPPPSPTLFVIGTGQLGSSSTGRLGW